MDYKDHVENLYIGMYSIIESSNSPLLEAFGKKQVNHEVSLHSKGFRRYLKSVYKDKDLVKEIKAAKTMDQKWELAKRYSKDFKEYKKIKNVKMVAILGYLGFSAATAYTNISVDLATRIVGWLFFGADFYSINKKIKDRGKKEYNDFVNKDRNENTEENE